MEQELKRLLKKPSCSHLQFYVVLFYDPLLLFVIDLIYDVLLLVQFVHFFFFDALLLFAVCLHLAFSFFRPQLFIAIIIQPSFLPHGALVTPLLTFLSYHCRSIPFSYDLLFVFTL